MVPQKNQNSLKLRLFLRKIQILKIQILENLET